MHQTPDDLDMFVHRQLTRRQLVGGVVATLSSAGLATKARSADVPADPTVRSPKRDSSHAAMKAKPTEMGGYDREVLPPGIRSRFVNDVNGLRIHVLEAGFEGQDRPCVLLLHGFPELAYSWRKVMLPLASPGLITITLGFFLFRFFDVFKPPPANFFNKRKKGGYDVVMDDVFAGIYANLVLQGAVYLFLS